MAKIDGEKESRIVKLVFYLGLELANTAERPKWNPESYKQVVQPPTGAGFRIRIAKAVDAYFHAGKPSGPRDAFTPVGEEGSGQWKAERHNASSTAGFAARPRWVVRQRDVQHDHAWRIDRHRGRHDEPDNLGGARDARGAGKSEGTWD